MNKPMLLSNDEYNLEELDYTNMFISVKRDGVRAEITRDGIVGRSLKKFRNPRIEYYFKEFFSTLPEGLILEGEIYCHGVLCAEMSGVCSSKSHPIPGGTKLYIFGVVDLDLPFEERYEKLKELLSHAPDNIEMVEQHQCPSHEFASVIYKKYIEKGYEGAVLMDGSKKYKQGRVTIKEHIGFKMKPEREDDLEIIGVTERMLNTNESQINELGHSFKRDTVDAKEPTGIAACFTCKLPNGETCDVTITGDENFRRNIWNNKQSYIGKYAVVKSMDYQQYKKLRHPRLVSIKEQCEK